MQIRLRKSRVECIRTVYDPAIKRGRGVYLGSFDRYGTPPESLTSVLGDEEKAQLAQWLKTLQDSSAWESLCFQATSAHGLERSMREVARWFGDERVTEDQARARAQALWSAWSELKSAMRKRGGTRVPLAPVKKAHPHKSTKA